jgi:hypothetical protein
MQIFDSFFLFLVEDMINEVDIDGDGRIDFNGIIFKFQRQLRDLIYFILFFCYFRICIFFKS